VAVRFRPPASIELRRAQILLVLAALVPTILATVAAILVLVLAQDAADVVLGILVLVFGLLAITGAVFVQIFLRRGDSLARMQNDFVSSVSHELRTPLTSIRLFVETLALGRVQHDEAETRHVLAMLASEVGRLDQLVERVLDLARMEAGKRKFTLQPVKVRDIVEGARQAFEVVRLAGGGPPAKVEQEVDPELVIDADRTAFEQALVNLLSNAYKYTGDDKHIVVRAQGHGRTVEISVTDNGPGISRTGQDAAAHAPQGTGMGLAVVDLIVRAHRGRVDVQSQPGQGATFRLRVPRSVQA
jgi:two-component system phosphate regulon sensor histidine kinase PhoR